MTDVTGQASPKSTSRSRLAISLALAGLAAVSGAMLAPADWPAGSGAVLLDVEGSPVISAPVTLGGSEPVELTGRVGDVEFQLVFPEGIPLDRRIEAFISVRGSQSPLPDLGDLTLSIALPDGRVEPIPVGGLDESQWRIEASRQPTHDAAVVLGLLGFVTVMWVTEALPLFVTSLLIPVVLVVGRVATAGAALAPFANPIIILFFAGFLMAEAMSRSGLDHWVSVAITARAGRSAVNLFATMIGLAAFLSMWMSNTAAAAVLVPIAIAITAPIDHPGYRKALVLGIAYAATIGGVGSAIGTPANLLAIEFLDGFGGRSISFVEWFGFGLPMVALFLPLMGWYLWRRSDVRLEPGRLEQVRALAREERSVLGKPSGDQIHVLVVFGLVGLGWLTETFHGVHPGVVALTGAVLLFVTGRLVPADLGSISWSALLTFGGGLTLGLYVAVSGVSDFVATRLGGLASVPAIIALLAVAMVTLLLTTVASNTASAAILIPLAIPLAPVIGVSTVELVVVVAIASSIDFALVVGTPPTMIAYSTRLFTAGHVFRTGIALDLAGIALLVLVVSRVWGWIGLV